MNDRNIHRTDPEPDMYRTMIQRIIRIVALCSPNSITLTPQEAEHAWRGYSATVFAGFINLPPNDHAVWACIRPHIPYCEHCGRERVMP